MLYFRGQAFKSVCRNIEPLWRRAGLLFEMVVAILSGESIIHILSTLVHTSVIKHSVELNNIGGI